MASIEALSGKATLYLTSTFLILFFSGMPTKEFDFDKKLRNYGVIFLVVLELTLLNVTQFSYSPMYSLYGLSREILSQFETRHRIANLEISKEDFYNTEVENFRDKPIEMVEKPNVILIFTEGLSQNIIDDTREIMPNVSNIQQQSLNFENYFNHSFATYRGLQGQLYSGYQFFDQDKNNLISLQQIFSMNGYSTKFINSEPKNDTFTKYLLDFEFDELVTTEKLSGPAETVSDKDLYDLLWSEIVKASTFDKPFFISTYSFGTHISLDSPDEK
ncbi:TPA: sulfatase-like hydrolase/transferase, partial [Streptococcus suis]